MKRADVYIGSEVVGIDNKHFVITEIRKEIDNNTYVCFKDLKTGRNNYVSIQSVKRLLFKGVKK